MDPLPNKCIGNKGLRRGTHMAFPRLSAKGLLEMKAFA